MCTHTLQASAPSAEQSTTDKASPHPCKNAHMINDVPTKSIWHIAQAPDVCDEYADVMNLAGSSHPSTAML